MYFFSVYLTLQIHLTSRAIRGKQLLRHKVVAESGLAKNGACFLLFRLRYSEVETRRHFGAAVSKFEISLECQLEGRAPFACEFRCLLLGWLSNNSRVCSRELLREFRETAQGEAYVLRSHTATTHSVATKQLTWAAKRTALVVEIVTVLNDHGLTFSVKPYRISRRLN